VPAPRDLARRALAEALGTGLLVTVVVGSGIMAQRLSPGQTGLQLLENSTATALGLAVLILILGPVSGAHFNPVVTLADHVLGRRTGRGVNARGASARGVAARDVNARGVDARDVNARGVDARGVAAYIPAQIAGGIGGTMLANLMFALPAATVSSHTRTGGHLWLGETVATAGLILLIFALTRTGRGGQAPAAVGAYIGAAYWFTSSTSFANPAVTIARTLTDTFAGIAPASVPGFVVAQLLGAGIGVLAVLALFPHAPTRSTTPAKPDESTRYDTPAQPDAPTRHDTPAQPDAPTRHDTPAQLRKLPASRSTS
jgi:arsenate reductase